MKATFIGVPGEDHAEITMYGQTFPRGKAVKVESRQAMRKLVGHPHFKTEAEASDNAEDAAIKREFTGATEAALADEQARREAEEARASEAARLAASAPPAPESATPEPMRSAQEYQDRVERAPLSPSLADINAPSGNLSMPTPEATDGNAERAGDADSSQDPRGRTSGKSKR